MIVVDVKVGQTQFFILRRQGQSCLPNRPQVPLDIINESTDRNSTDRNYFRARLGGAGRYYVQRKPEIFWRKSINSKNRKNSPGPYIAQIADGTGRKQHFQTRPIPVSVSAPQLTAAPPTTVYACAKTR